MPVEPQLTFEFVTIFPELVHAFASTGLLGKAVDAGRVRLLATNPRDFAADARGTVDDAPFGGGAGMVLSPGPMVAALESIESQRGEARRILLTPSAPTFDQRAAQRLASEKRIVLICGRYEGVDERVREGFVDESFSLGDFVLNGGEVAAFAIVEAVARLCEGVIGNPESLRAESHASRDRFGSLLEYPQFTRPESFRGVEVPAVLRSGDHERIRRWRLAEAVAKTRALRPDLREPLAPLRVVCASWPHDAAGLGKARREVRKRGGAEPWLIGVDTVPDCEVPRWRELSGALDYLRTRDSGEGADGAIGSSALFVAGWRQMRSGDAVAERLDAIVDARDLCEIDLAKPGTLIDISQPQAAGPADRIRRCLGHEGLLP